MRCRTAGMSAGYRHSNSTHFRVTSRHFTFILRTNLHIRVDQDGITQMSNYLGRTRKLFNYRLATPRHVCPVHNNDSADCNIAWLSILNVINKSIDIINYYKSCSRPEACQQQMQMYEIECLRAVSIGIQISWDVTPCLWMAPSSSRVKAFQKQTCYMKLEQIPVSVVTQTCIQEQIGYNIGQNADYPYWFGQANTRVLSGIDTKPLPTR